MQMKHAKLYKKILRILWANFKRRVQGTINVSHAVREPRLQITKEPHDPYSVNNLTRRPSTNEVPHQTEPGKQPSVRNSGRSSIVVGFTISGVRITSAFPREPPKRSVTNMRCETGTQKRTRRSTPITGNHGLPLASDTLLPRKQSTIRGKNIPIYTGIQWSELKFPQSETDGPI